MLDFLRKFFRKKQEFASEDVELDNLAAWLDENTRQNIDSLNEELGRVSQSISEGLAQARENVEVLNNAKLLNPDIPERAKHFMQGNRDAFSKKINLFLDSVHVPSSVDDFPVFYSGVQDELKELMQGTARPLQILQEFFAHESGKVMASVGNIEKEINLFRNAFDNAGLDILDDTRKRIFDLQTKVRLKDALEKDLEAQQKELEEIEKDILQLKSDVELLQKDRDFNLLKDTLKGVQARIEEARERIMGPFSVINPALRKYEYISYRHRFLVQKYIESPLDALMQDLHLGIVKALRDMELAVMNNRLDLKDKKKDKTLEVLKLLSREYLGNFLAEYGQIKHEQDKLMKEIESLEVVVLMKEKKERIQKLENNRIDVERKIDLFSKEISKADIKELEDKLVENLKKITKTVVKIC